MTVAYFDQNKEWRFTIIGIIISCGLVMYIFDGHVKKKFPVLY